MALAACPLLIGIVHLAYHVGYTIDDAYITFRYAKNLARGLGLTFNPGEPVKGYSNTLFTLLMAGVCYRLGWDPEMAAKAIGFGSFVTLAGVCYRLGTRLTSTALWPAPCIPALLAVLTPLSIWYVAGLETGLYTTLIFAGTLRRLYEQEAAGRHPWSATIFALVVLSRPEGIAIFCAAAVHDLLVGAKARRLSRSNAIFLTVPLVVYALELMLSQAYYGRPFPQTFYAKIEDSHRLLESAGSLVRGIEWQWRKHAYLATSLRHIGWSAWLWALCAVALFDRRRMRTGSALWLIIAAQVAFIARVHNDWMPAGRFVVPMLPAMVVLAVMGISRAAEVLPFGRWLGFALALLVFVTLVPENLRRSQRAHQRRHVDAGYHLRKGGRIAAIVPPGGTFSSFDVGGQGYASELDLLDTAGLTDPNLVRCWNHERSSRCLRYLALRDPDYLRLHRRKDRWVRSLARHSETYIVLKRVENHDLVHRRVVLAEGSPDHVARLQLDFPTGIRLVGVDAPASARPSAQVDLVLYFRRADRKPKAIRKRTVSLMDLHGNAHLCSTHSLWHLAKKTSAWPKGRVFVDRMRCQMPSQPGNYRIHLAMRDRQAAIGGIEVVRGADEVAARAARIHRRAKQLEHASPAQALVMLSRALELHDTSAVRHSYRRAALRHANALAAPQLRGEAALRNLQRIKRILHAAVTRTRSARGLQDAIRRNARQRHQLVQAALDAPRPEET